MFNYKSKIYYIMRYKAEQSRLIVNSLKYILKYNLKSRCNCNI